MFLMLWELVIKGNTMNDEKYFTKCTQAFNTLFPLEGSERAYLKDANFKYKALTNKMLYMLGGGDIDEIINKNIAEVAERNILCKNGAHLIKTLMQQEIQIKQQKKSKLYLQTMFLNGKIKIWVQANIPIINPETNNFVGIRGQIAKLCWPHVAKTLLKMHGATGMLINHKNNKIDPLKEYPLNNKQHMVLFLCLHNYSYSEISLLLDESGYKINAARVNEYLEQLKFIFHVRSKNELAEKAIGLNLHTCLPDGLFNKTSSIEITNDDLAKIYCLE